MELVIRHDHFSGRQSRHKGVCIHDVKKNEPSASVTAPPQKEGSVLG